MAAFATSERFEVLDPKDRDRLEALSKLDEFKSGEEIPVSGQAGESLLSGAALSALRARPRAPVSLR